MLYMGTIMVLSWDISPTVKQHRRKSGWDFGALRPESRPMFAAKKHEFPIPYTTTFGTHKHAGARFQVELPFKT